jgi:porin
MPSRIQVGLAVLAAALIGSTARAEPGSSVGHHLLHSARLFGDPGGARSRLEELGVTVQLFYNQFLAWKPAGGGIDPSSTTGHSGSYDFITLVDLEALTGWPAAEFLLRVKGQYDRNINASVGALSNPIDDADFDEPIYVDELWLQQRLWRDRLRLRLGFLEQQTLFDRNAYANSEDRQFMSTFLDNNAVVPLPNGLGATLIALPMRGLEIATGCADADNVPRKAGFDTTFDGIDSITGYLELTLRPAAWGALAGLPGAYRLGVFLDGRELPIFGTGDSLTDPELDRGHWGAYLNFDQLAWSEPGPGEQGLGVFGRFGYADPKVNRIAWFWSLGLQYQGPLPGRDADRVGFGVYQAIGSKRYQEEVDADFERETGIELYYHVQALPWLALTPDFQYIVDPGANGAADNAVVVALRLRLSF